MGNINTKNNKKEGNGFLCNLFVRPTKASGLHWELLTPFRVGVLWPVLGLKRSCVKS